MVADAAAGASIQMAAADCISRFLNGPDATAQLAALKKAESYQRSDPPKRHGLRRREQSAGGLLHPHWQLVAAKTADAKG